MRPQDPMRVHGRAEGLTRNSLFRQILEARTAVVQAKYSFDRHMLRIGVRRCRALRVNGSPVEAQAPVGLGTTDFLRTTGDNPSSIINRIPVPLTLRTANHADAPVHDAADADSRRGVGAKGSERRGWLGVAGTKGFALSGSGARVALSGSESQVGGSWRSGRYSSEYTDGLSTATNGNVRYFSAQSSP